MTTSVAALETTLIVDPDRFVARFREHWRYLQEREDVSNPSLEAIWRLISTAFNEQIQNHEAGRPGRWVAIPAQTGTGKSESIAIYCSMLAPVWDLSPWDRLSGCVEQHPGVLVLTRLKEQATCLKNRINDLCGSDYAAIAYHGDARDVPADELCEYPVLIITHSAYEHAMDKLNQEQVGRVEKGFAPRVTWHEYTKWGSSAGTTGTRRLTIIDEALDLVQGALVSLDDLEALPVTIPNPIRKQFPKEFKILQGLAMNLSNLADQLGGQEQLVKEDTLEILCDLTPMRHALRKASPATILRVKDTQDEHEWRRVWRDKILRDIQSLIEQWNVYMKKGDRHILTTGKLLIPENILNAGAVILDATADHDIMYELLGDRATVLDVPQDGRTYTTGTLHHVHGLNMGRDYMVDNAVKDTPIFIKNLKGSIPKDRSVFCCTHKDLQPHLASYKKALGFQEFDIAYWGKVDGLNMWSHFDTGVIYGFPYLPPERAVQVIHAILGPKLPTETRDRLSHLRHKFQVSKITCRIIQAANRIRSRRVVDASGTCLPFDLWITFPKDIPTRLGSEVLEKVVAGMPGIQTIVWPYNSGQPQQAIRRTDAEDGFVAYCKNLDEGEHRLGAIMRTLRLSRDQVNRFMYKLRYEPESLVAKELTPILSHEVRRERSRQVAFLIVKPKDYRPKW